VSIVGEKILSTLTSRSVSVLVSVRLGIPCGLMRVDAVGLVAKSLCCRQCILVRLTALIAEEIKSQLLGVA